MCLGPTCECFCPGVRTGSFQCVKICSVPVYFGPDSVLSVCVGISFLCSIFVSHCNVSLFLLQAIQNKT